MKSLSPRLSRLVNVLSLAEARRLSSQELYPEHILLAMLKDENGLGYELFKALSINIQSFIFALEQNIISRNASYMSLNSVSPNQEVRRSQRFSTMMDIAVLETQPMGNPYVGTEHVVLACIREKDSCAYNFFNKAGISISQAREKAKELQISLKGSFGSYEDNNEDEILDSNRFSSIPLESLLRVKKGTPFNEILSGTQDVESNRPKTTFLDEYSRDITRLCKEGKMDPVVGRTKEITRLIQILSRRTKNNPVLVGDPGIGKTAIVEGLAQAICHGDVPTGLINKRVLSLDLASLIAGTKYRGEFEERMKRLMKEIQENKNIILFLDELHTIIGAGSPEGSMDASNILKPALSRGEIQLIGATTTKEYTRYIEKDSAFARRFQMIKVEEPDDEDTILILEGIKKQYEVYHKVIYQDDVIPTIVKLSRRYIPERFLPDKAIDILDEVGAIKKISQDRKNPNIYNYEKEISQLMEEKRNFVKTQNYERAAFIRDRVLELQHRIDLLSTQRLVSSENLLVTKNDVEAIVSEMTGIPLDSMDSNESQKLLNMEGIMHKMVIGQSQAVSSIAGAVRRSRSGISSSKHPIGSFIFLGPTGVGKTQLAKALSKFLFGKEDSLIRIDMSDYMEKHNASRLVGAPPGYVGYEDGGLLTEQVRRHPYSVVLLDEIEKAHPDVFNLLLQILEEGELKDNLGHTVNFRNTVIIMTSNAGSRKITSDSIVGFNTGEEGILSYSEIKSSAISELKKLMNPEILNRIDDIIVFDTLKKEEIREILDIQLQDLINRLLDKDLHLTVTDSAKSYLVEHGFDASMGARPMKRLIQKEIEDPLSLKVLDEKYNNLHNITVDLKDGSLSIDFDLSLNVEGAEVFTPLNIMESK